MTEAETLCSRVAIMANGEVRVVGTPLALKERFGNGYNLQIALTDTVETTVDSCMHFVLNTLHERAVLFSRQGRVLKVSCLRWELTNLDQMVAGCLLPFF
jgi:ABC-type multidrug transport system ATPase subunit